MDRKENLKKTIRLAGFILPFIGLAILIIATAIISQREFKRQEINQHLGVMRLIADTAANNLSKYIIGHTKQLLVLGQTEAIISMLINQDGPKKATNAEFLKALYLTNRDDTNAIFIVDRNSIVLEVYPQNYNSMAFGQNHSDRPEIKYITEQSKPYVSDIFKTKDEKSAISLTAPVIHYKKYMGALTWLIESEMIYKSVLDKYNRGSRATWVIDIEGKTVAHPVSYHVGEKYLEIHEQKYPNVDWTGLRNLNQQMLSGKRGGGVFEYHESYDLEAKSSPTLIAFSPLTVFNRTWVVVITMPFSEIEPQIKKYETNSFLAVAVFLLMLIVMGLSFLGIIKQRRGGNEPNNGS